jgi:hypothetical protein
MNPGVRRFHSIAAISYRGAAAGDEGDGDHAPSIFGAGPTPREDLPYKVELWDERRTAVEVVLAVTSSSSIGFAAYYAATREYPERHVTLRHKGSVIARWPGPGH